MRHGGLGCTALALLAAALAGCGGGGGMDAPPVSAVSVKFTRAFPRLSFDQPLFLASAPGDPAHLYVATQTGAIKVFDAVADPAAASDFLVLDVDAAGEQGLLGLAFDPAFASNRMFYVYYSPASGARRTRISRFQALGATLADAGSEQVLLEIAQPEFENHKGGMLAFGPDGQLYVGVGDGGSANDPSNNAQDLGTLLGKVLRITRTGGIPADNPFVGTGGARGEIWAYGLRNPWRFSFDGATLWLGDVGQGAREEIDLVQRGGNYGWRVYEGTRSNVNPANRPPADFAAPLHEYDHDGGRCAIAAGYVYRGSAVPQVQGRYLYADFCSGQVWALARNGASATTTQVATVPSPASFGVDAAGELYVTSFDGDVYRMTP